MSNLAAKRRFELAGTRSMRIGIEARYITEGVSGGITPLVVETFSRVFELAPTDHFYFFGTIFNQNLFLDRFPNLRKYSLPLPIYWKSVESLLMNEKVDVLFRSFPADDTLSFPLRKQI